MNTVKKTAVLVLGAPRSGTSSISHVINELGFYFGDPGRFVDPFKHPWNPIFFEQQSLNNLNDEIAKALGLNYLDFDWLPLKEDFSEEFVLGFEERVDRLLGNEFGTHERIALKDPRFCLTLPVWSLLLTRRGYRVRYVWAVRDLSSCFMSNKAVDNSHPNLHERLVTLSSYSAGYFLDGEDYFLANYDQFIKCPDVSVSALANWLEVSDPRVDIACRVIQAQLRHLVASKNSLAHELEAISELLLNGKLTANHYLEFRRYLFAHGFIGLLQERRHVIADLRCAVAAKDEYISGLLGTVALKDQAVAERDIQIASLNQAVVELHGQVGNLNQVVTERDGQIVNLNTAISVRNGQIASLNQAVVELHGQVDNLNQVVTERDGQIAILNQAVLVYQNSTSWRVTRPLRIIGDQIKRINHALAETKASRRFAQGPLRFHIDKPIWIVNIVKDSCLVSGWAVNLEAGSAAKVRIVIGKALHHPHPEQREDVRRMFGPVCELPRDTGFAIVLTLPVGIHWMWIEVKGVDGVWIPIRRALLLRIPGKSRTQGTEPRLSYNAWARLEQKRLKAELPDIRRHIDVMLHKPVFARKMSSRRISPVKNCHGVRIFAYDLTFED